MLELKLPRLDSETLDFEDNRDSPGFLSHAWHADQRIQPEFCFFGVSVLSSEICSNPSRLLAEQQRPNNSNWRRH